MLRQEETNMKKMISFRLDKELIMKGKQIAKEEKKSFTQLITDILFNYIRGRNGKKKA